MSKFSDLLATLSAPFKTLPQATAALEPAKATLDSVNALFTAAGLPLEQMLATGPEALKAHLASLDKSADVTRLQGELTTATKNLADTQGSLTAVNAIVAQHEKIFAAVGLNITAGTPTPEAFKTAFAAHVAKETTLALAKGGHPPKHVPAPEAPEKPAVATDAQIHAEWKAMKPGPERLAFFTTHEATITAFERNAA